MDTQDEYPTDTYHISLIQGIVIAEIENRSLLATDVTYFEACTHTVLAPVLTLCSTLPSGLLNVLLTFPSPPKWILVIDGHVPGPEKALIWPQHVSSPLSKQAQVYQTAMAHYFSAADILPSISPLPSPCRSANFVALRVKETIEQQLIAASDRRMGAGCVMDDATAADQR